MPGCKKNSENRNLSTLQQSLQTIHEFVNEFPVDQLEEHSWELMSTAFSSESANSWSVWERSIMLQLYKHLSKLGQALAIVDDQLWVQYAKGEMVS
jgi:hypothetical protein